MSSVRNAKFAVQPHSFEDQCRPRYVVVVLTVHAGGGGWGIFCGWSADPLRHRDGGSNSGGSVDGTLWGGRHWIILNVQNEEWNYLRMTLHLSFIICCCSHCATMCQKCLHTCSHAYLMSFSCAYFGTFCCLTTCNPNTLQCSTDVLP